MSDRIRPAIFPTDSAKVLDIWREYLAGVSVSLDFQDNAAELPDLPGNYAAPHGCVLLAERGGAVAGCVAMRRVEPRICEMKRLYVRPGWRGYAFGRRLAEAVIVAARTAGYAEMRLDVLAEFAAAQALYADLGFVEAPPVVHNPIPGTRFLGLTL